MTDPDSSVQYTDRRVFHQYIGFAEVLLLAPERALVSSWLGRCFILDLESGASWAEPETQPPNLPIRAGECLRSLTISGGSPPICAVATRAVWASVWQLGARESVQLHPKTGGPVNAVAVSPQGDRLALGTGYYPLAPGDEPKAFVELWDTTDPRVCRAARRLPGVVVDRLAWDATGTRLLVSTGAITQDRGHVALLDGLTLALLDVAEVESCGCSALHLNLSNGTAILVYRKSLEVRVVEELARRERFWALDEKVYGAAFTVDGDEALLTNGLRIDLWSEECRKLPPLPRCTGVALRPDGGGVGISEDGILRVWGG